MVWAGIMLYGLYPSNEDKDHIKLKPAMTLRLKFPI